MGPVLAASLAKRIFVGELVMKSFVQCVVLATGLASAGAALAGPFTSPAANQIYRAEDPMPFVNGVLAATSVFEERNRFLRNFNVTLGAFDFEDPILNGTTGPAPAAAIFQGSAGTTIRADLATTGDVYQGQQSGRFNTTAGGLQHLRVNSDNAGTFTLTFDKAISAFGFFGTDIGDFGGTLSLILRPEGGNTNGADDQTVEVRRGNGQKNEDAGGNLLFFGFAGANLRYSSITFRSVGDVETGDYFGFDDFYVADAGQFITTQPPTGMPEPGSLALAGLALLAAGACRKGRKQA